MDHRRWLAELDPDTVRPGLLGLVVVLALVVATALLLRSFTHQLKKIDFDESGGDAGGRVDRGRLPPDIDPPGEPPGGLPEPGA